MMKIKSLLLFGVVITGVTCDFQAKTTEFGNKRSKMSLSDFSICCTVPELATESAIQKCENPRSLTICGDYKCLFESAGWLKSNVIDKQAFKKHLQNFSNKHQKWSLAVDLAIADCINKDPRKVLESCDPYDLITCVNLAFIKKCPAEAWKC